jgi:hypothetical protein
MPQQHCVARQATSQPGTSAASAILIEGGPCCAIRLRRNALPKDAQAVVPLKPTQTLTLPTSYEFLAPGFSALEVEAT